MIKLQRYLKLQMRQAFGCFSKGIIALALAILVAITAIIMVGRTYQNTDENKITVAIVAPGEEFVMGALLEYIGEEDSLKSFCELKRMDFDSAMSGMDEQTVSMAIVVPQDFFAKASTMQEASIDIYVPADRSSAQRKLISIIQGVEEMMITTEGAITAMYDGMSLYSFPVSTSEMETALFMQIIEQFTSRADAYKTEYVSAYGEYSPIQFYIVSAVIFSFLICGITYLGLYSEGNRSLERLMLTTYSERLEMSFIKIISMCIPNGIFLTCLIIISRIVCDLKELSMTGSGAGVFIAAWLFAFSEAVFIHFIVSACSARSHIVAIYFLIILIVSVCSGILVPAVYLPAFIRPLSEYLPIGQWQGALLKGLWNNGRHAMPGEWGVRILITDVFAIAISVFTYYRSLSKYD